MLGYSNKKFIDAVNKEVKVIASNMQPVYLPLEVKIKDLDTIGNFDKDRVVTKKYFKELTIDELKDKIVKIEISHQNR